MYLFALVCALTCHEATAKDFIVLQSTTSTKNSGLYDHLIPLAEATLDVEIRVVAVGTGQALRNAQNCDADVLIVHAKQAEDAFVAAGFGIKRHDLMYNDFVLIGPNGDPAPVMETQNLSAAFGNIAKKSAKFASRGDDSGTHKKERALWAASVHDPLPESGTWYLETGSGMGATLNIAVELGAYTLSDRATWLTFQNKRNHRIVYQNDPLLFNQYGVIAVSPDHCPKTKTKAADRFITWLLGSDGQSAIAAHTLDGQALFTPNAQP